MASISIRQTSLRMSATEQPADGKSTINMWVFIYGELPVSDADAAVVSSHMRKLYHAGSEPRELSIADSAEVPASVMIEEMDAFALEKGVSTAFRRIFETKISPPDSPLEFEKLDAVLTEHEYAMRDSLDELGVSHIRLIPPQHGLASVDILMYALVVSPACEEAVVTTDLADHLLPPGSAASLDDADALLIKLRTALEGACIQHHYPRCSTSNPPPPYLMNRFSAFSLRF